MTPIEFYPKTQQPLLIVISGPSGVGKDSVLSELKSRQLPFHYIVTATTRQPRAAQASASAAPCAASMTCEAGL